MKLALNLVGVLSVVAISIGCGRMDAQKNLLELADDRENFESNVQADAEAFALSLPIGEKAKEGVIVVENSVAVKRADVALPKVYPQPPAPTCILHAGAHLVSVGDNGSSGASFIAKVSYPKGVKFSLLKKSCKELQPIIVEAQSGFKGLAITANALGAAFIRDSEVAIPKPPLPPLPPKPCLEVTNGKTVGCLPPKDIPVEKDAAAAIESKHGADVQGSPEEKAKEPIIPPENKEDAARVSPPSYGSKCLVFAGRSNIRVSAPKDRKTLLGQTARVSGAMDTKLRASECELGAQLQIDGERLSVALRKELVVKPQSDDPKVVVDPPVKPLEPGCNLPLPEKRGSELPAEPVSKLPSEPVSAEPSK